MHVIRPEKDKPYSRSRVQTGKELKTGKFLPYAIIMAAFFLCSCDYGGTGAERVTARPAEENSLKSALNIGWDATDITPEDPAIITGQMRLRVSEGVMDPITATALALESASGDGVIMISCDFISIPDEIRGGDFRGIVRRRVNDALPEGVKPLVVLNATHTHAGPEIRTSPGRSEKLADLGVDVPEKWQRWGVELDAVSPSEYVDFATKRIAESAVRAWESREAGGVSFGLSHAVVGHNRIMTYKDGTSRMYGPTAVQDFSHVEGWEDHSVNIVSTWRGNGELSGLIINIPSPAQHDEGAFKLSADFYHETREELRKRLGSHIHVLAQNSAAGDQSERVMVHRRAEERMENITGKNRRERIAERIADAVEGVLPYLAEHINWNPVFLQSLEKVYLTRQDNTVSEETYESAKKAFEEYKEQYLQKRLEIEKKPQIREQGRWYLDLADAYRAMRSEAGKIAFYREQQKREQAPEPAMPVEIYVLRLGDFALATNPFELYLDFGVRIQERSPAVQTFLVQLSGSGTYIAPGRSVEKGAYGSRNSLFKVPEAGRELVERTLELISGKFGDGPKDEMELKHDLERADSIILPREGWLFRKDPDEEGTDGGWYRADYDYSGWVETEIEQHWQDANFDYLGAAWYRREIKVEEFDIAKINFHAVDGDASLWINGEYAGTDLLRATRGWLDPFWMDVTPYMLAGEDNLIVVRVKKTKNLAGIHQPVELILGRVRK